MTRKATDPNPAPPQLGHGVVAGVAPFTIKVDGATVDATAYVGTGYTPQVGDTVYWAFYRGSHIVLGRESPGGPGTAPGKAVFRGYVGSAASLTSGGNQKLLVSVASIDTAAGFSVANYWYQVQQSGIYRVSGQILVGAVSPNILGISIYQNGTGVSAGGQIEAGPSGSYYGVTVSDILTCASGDTLALWAYNTSSGAPLLIGSTYNYLIVEQVA